jgi:hypothetical protein
VYNVPWANLTAERTKIYKKYLKKDIENIEDNFDLKMKDILIRAEIQKRDFTKRQLNILSLIITFSYPYGKEKALLKPTDFSLAGVPMKIIKSELEKMIELNIIEWDQDFNEFSVKEAKLWKAPYHQYYDDKRSQELFVLNLRHAGIPVAEMLEELKNTVL